MNFLVFIVANAMYSEVFEIVGYMYEVNLHVSFLNVMVGCLLLLLLTMATDFENTIYRHGLDVCVLGVFLPIAVVSCQINSSIVFMFYAFASVCLMSLAARLFEGSALIKGMNQLTISGISFQGFQWGVFLFYAAILLFLVASDSSGFNFNLVDIYLRTYEIRSERQGGGLLDYFIGWFILVFFPILLCTSAGRLKVVAPLFALLGALYVFQAFAVKVIFLNFFLIAVFAFAYRMSGALKEYLPQVFFLLLFLVSHLIGLLAFPLLDRFFYIVGLNSIFYFDFFTQNSLRYFEGSKLDFGISRYGMDAGFLIDNAYYQGLGTNQSAGFLPTMFADLGIVGVLLASIALGGLMAIIKSMRSSSESFSYLVMISFAFSLMNYSFNMLFLSNGLAFIMLVALILRRKKVSSF